MKPNRQANKPLELLLYVAARAGRRDGIHWVCKMLYLADKKHLEEYGRTMSDDHYVAMEFGPVPSYCYDLYKDVRYDRSENPSYAEAIEAFSTHGRSIEPSREADEFVLSDSERECLDYAIAKFGPLSFDQLTDLGHDEAWQKAFSNATIPTEDIIRTLDDSEAILEYYLDYELASA